MTGRGYGIDGEEAKVERGEEGDCTTYMDVGWLLVIPS